MTVRFSETYTGSDSSAPNSTTHVTAVTGTGSTIDIQSNRLRMLGGTTGSYGSTARTLLRDAAGANFDIANAEIVCIWDHANPKAEQFSSVCFRTTNDWTDAGNSNPVSGYVVEPNPSGNTVSLFRNPGGVFLATPAYTFVAGTRVFIKVRFIGSSIKARVWDEGTDEPTSWLIDQVDATFTSGGIQLRNSNGAAAASRTSNVDDVNVNDLTWTERLGRRR